MTFTTFPGDDDDDDFLAISWVPATFLLPLPLLGNCTLWASVPEVLRHSAGPYGRASGGQEPVHIRCSCHATLSHSTWNRKAVPLPQEVYLGVGESQHACPCFCHHCDLPPGAKGGGSPGPPSFPCLLPLGRLTSTPPTSPAAYASYIWEEWIPPS